MTRHRRQWDIDFRDSPFDSEYFSVLPAGTLMDFGGGGSPPDYGSYINNATNAANAQEEKMWGEVKAMEQPYLQAGAASTGQLGSMLGLSGYPTVDPTQQLQSTPGYQWALNQGIGVLNTQDASTGNLYSGAHQKGLMNYGQGMATQAYNQYMSNLMGLSGQGAGVAGQTGKLGMDAANTMGQNTITGANALASSQMAQYNAQQRSQSNLGSLLGIGAGILAAPFTGGTSLIGSGGWGSYGYLSDMMNAIPYGK